MSVLLVLLMFAVFVAIDYLRTRQRGEEPSVAPAMEPETVPAIAIAEPAYAGGFHVPGSFRYHAGHGWVMKERKNQARVGVDELAAKILGAVDEIQLPAPGRWVRQGQRVLSFFRNGQKVEISSPVEGEILEVNEELLRKPEKLRTDPYGEGWLMTVHVPDEGNTQRNLIPRKLVPAWMDEAVDRLYAQQPQLAGPVMAEGGEPVTDLTAALPAASWKELAEKVLQDE